jgi:hypothetical protein
VLIPAQFSDLNCLMQFMSYIHIARRVLVTILGPDRTLEVPACSAMLDDPGVHFRIATRNAASAGS